MSSEEKNESRFFARPDNATNMPSDDTVLIPYPPCPACKGTDFAAIYEERRWTTYPSAGITLDGIIAENENEPTASDEADFVPMRSHAREWRIIECEGCHALYAPVVEDERTVLLISAPEDDTEFSHEPEAG